VTSTILDWLQELHPAVLLVIMVVLAAGEAALFLDLLVPGEVAMVVGGAVLANDDPSGRIGWVIAGMAAAAIGAVLGDSLSYWLGRTIGTRLIRRWDFLKRHLGPGIERAQHYFERGGGPVVAVARFVGPLRAVVPFVAGSSGMDYRRFLQWDVPAAIVWGTLMVGLGAAFGEAIARTIDRLDWWFTIVIVVVIVGYFVFRTIWKRTHREAA
jgi:membrane-associated protein